MEITHKRHDLLFSGRQALVVGGGGIGYAIANCLKDADCNVIVAGKSAHNFENLIYEKWDVTNIKTIPDKIKELVGKYGDIDIVVNAQGICPEPDFTQNIYKVTPNDFKEVFKINLESVYFICLEFCKYFQNNNIRGNILNIASSEGFKGSKVPYGISKAGVISLYYLRLTKYLKFFILEKMNRKNSILDLYIKLILYYNNAKFIWFISKTVIFTRRR